MGLTYRCACFAIPFNLLDAAPLSDNDAAAKPQSSIDEASRLRAKRTAIAMRKKVVPPKKAPFEIGRCRRQVFDVGNGKDLPGKLTRTEGQKPVGDIAVDSAYDNVGTALDFYFQVFKRDSVNDRGAIVKSAVHYDVDFDNALWTGTMMVFGDGNLTKGLSRFTESIDLIAHELSHAVIQNLIPGGLGAVRIPVSKRTVEGWTHELRGEAGSLNESFADVMGSLVKQWQLKQNVRTADWLMGTDVLDDSRGIAIRSLKDPGNRQMTHPRDGQVKNMHQYSEGMHVHNGSGIPNHAFYLAAKAIGGFAWEKTGLIWYDAFATLKPLAKFSDAAKATLRIARRRFGDKSKEFKAVAAAWNDVNVIS